jgi:hypothetical protein
MSRVKVLTLAVVLLVGIPAAAFEVLEVEEPISVDGQVFTHMFYDLTEGAEDFHFELGRARLDFNGMVTEDVGFEVRVEAMREYGLEGMPPERTGRYTIHVRHAFMDVGGLVPDHHIYGGMIATPWNCYENEIWGWRMLRPVAVTEQDYLPVADLGLGFGGNFLGGTLDHHVTFTNGGGYTDLETSKGKNIDYRFTVKPFKPHTIIGGFSANILLHYGNVIDDPRPEDLAYGFLAGLEHDFVNFGAGYFRRKMDVTGVGEVNDYFITGYGWVKLPYHLHIVGRFDMIDPNADVNDNGYNDILFGFGLDFAGGHCKVMPNFRMRMVQDNAVDPDDGTPMAETKEFYLSGEINTF